MERDEGGRFARDPLAPVTPGDVRRLWYDIARKRAARGDKEGAAAARRSARTIPTEKERTGYAGIRLW